MQRLFPSDPYARTLLIPLTNKDVSNCYQTKEGSALLRDPQVHIIGLPAEDLENPILRSLANANLLRPGVVLAQNPYIKDRYIDIAEAELRFPVSKYFHFCLVCQALGASRVTIEDHNKKKRTETDKLTAGLDTDVADVGGVGAKVLSGSKLEAVFEEIRRLKVSYAGGPPNIEEAEQIVNQHNLGNDEYITTLLRSRKNLTNQIQDFDLFLNLTSETRQTLAIASKLKLKIPQFLKMSIDSSFDTSLSEKRDSVLALKVTFGQKSTTRRNKSSS